VKAPLPEAEADQHRVRPAESFLVKREIAAQDRRNCKHFEKARRHQRFVHSFRQ